MAEKHSVQVGPLGLVIMWICLVLVLGVVGDILSGLSKLLQLLPWAALFFGALQLLCWFLCREPKIPPYRDPAPPQPLTLVDKNGDYVSELERIAKAPEPYKFEIIDDADIDESDYDP